MSNIKEINIERGCSFDRGPRDQWDNELGAKSEVGCDKLSAYEWLEGYPTMGSDQIFEVRFKNTRKGYYANVNNLPLKKGDIVAVEATPGHDIGIISLTGDMVTMQMKRCGFRNDGVEYKKIYRLAKPYDIEKWQEAIQLEHQTMIESRRIASSLGLAMKIGDVEYQGDRLKAIFYYIADERVDFRELIKILADQFKIRIEMKQIGARQEAGRIGCIGVCGRESCCSKFVSSFVSVTTNSARFQEISLNPQKLAGQCGKLKCCLNYEVDSYIDAKKGFPKITAPLETLDGLFYLVKTEIFKKELTFSSDPHVMSNLVTISVQRAWEVLKLNRRGVKVDTLADLRDIKEDVKNPDYENVVGEESITRFDSSKNRNNRGRNGSRRNSQQRRRSDEGAATTGEGSSSEQESRPREGGEQRDNRPRRNDRDNRSRNRREPREQREQREQREPRENRPEGGEGENRQPRNNRDRQNSRNNRNSGRNENRESREPRERRARNDREPREPREPKSNPDNNPQG